MRLAKRYFENIFGLVTKSRMGTITSVETTEPVVALTFDDSPHPVFTPQLLKILSKYDAHATFFMVGAQAEQCPEIVKEVAQAGHAIGNHSWNHPSFPQVVKKERISQIHECEKVLAPYGQKLFRPPFGHQNVSSHIDLYKLGYEVIAWNLCAFDWLDNDANWITAKIMENIKPGNILLLHDAIYNKFEKKDDREIMHNALAATLEQLSGRFKFVTVPELLTYGNPIRRNWYIEGEGDW